MKNVCKELLKIKAVFLSPNNPFTWASGIKSPIYCDNRLTLSYPDTRKVIENGLANLVKEKFPNVEVLMGAATAGIPHAALVADILNLPMGYVRGKAKDHGRNNQIEGKAEKGQKCIVIEDLISTGGSSIEVVEALKEAELDCLGVISIFTYQMDSAKENFEKCGVPYYSLATYDELIEVAMEENYIQGNDINKLKEWKKDPKNEDWMNK